jgi:type I phosphodiesterase/nucleotide pyrophosphatase
VVSDRFHQLVGSIAEFDRAAYPPETLPVLQEAVTQSRSAGLADISVGRVPTGTQTPESSALQRDRLYSLAMAELSAANRPRFSAVRYEGLDTVGHHYLRFAQPQSVRGVPEEERRRYWQVIDHYYTYIDGEIGAALNALPPDDLLVVVSGFGMQPLSPVKHAIGRLLGDPDFSGTHERAPDGFLLAYGTTVEPGRHPRGSIVDVTPSLLYFLGLPVARDMDGFARADLFLRGFTAERPIAFIPTYGR